MVIGEEKGISISELFTYDMEKGTLTWETDELNSDELNDFVSDIEYRSEQLRKEEEKRIKLQREQREREEEEIRKSKEERQRRVQEEQRQYKQSMNPTQYDFEFVTATNSEQVSVEEMIAGYKNVIERMRNSSVIQSSPAFLERIKDCEDDIATFNLTGTIPSRIKSLIQMMKYAHVINDVS